MMMALIATFLTTIALMGWIMRRLRLQHSDLYKSSGMERAMTTDSMNNFVVFARFIYGSAWKSLDDRPLKIAMRGLQVLFALSMGLLAVSFAY